MLYFFSNDINKAQVTRIYENYILKHIDTLFFETFAENCAVKIQMIFLINKKYCSSSLNGDKSR